MDRDEFMELVYETFDDEPDNVLANGIIEAADAYAEHEKAQLSQEGTTSDLISRQAARHALCKAVHKGEDVPCENQTASCLWTGTRVCDFVREIDALPSVQPERKRGRWLPDNNSVYEMRFICSECKESEVVPTIGFTKYKPIWDFCPNCGADMRGEKDG